MTLSATLRHFLQALRLRKTALLFAISIILIGNLLSGIFFQAAQAVYDTDQLTAQVLVPTLKSLYPTGIVLLIVVAFVVECRIAGWNNSSLKRVLQSQSATRKTDWIYTVLYTSNVSYVLGFLFTLGIGYYLGQQIRSILGLNLLHNSNPIFSFISLLLFNSLMFYLFHRAAHSRFLWDMHKSHHSAEELNLITNFRSHPLELGIRNIFYAFPIAILGVSPSVYLVYSAFTGFLVLMQHSEIDWNMPFVEKYLFIGASGHRIHHSVDPLHYNTNLGFLVLWDRLFRTFHYEEKAKVRFGLDNNDLGIYNTGNMKTELLQIFYQTCKGLFRELRTRTAFKSN